MKTPKFKLLISFISLSFLLAIFIYLLVDINNPNNLFVQNRNRNQNSQRQANAAILLTDLKTAIDKQFLTVQQSQFNIEQSTYQGYKLILINPTDQEKTDSIGYLTGQNFNIINDQNTYKVLNRNNLYCITTDEQNNNFGIYCGIKDE